MAASEKLGRLGLDREWIEKAFDRAIKFRLPKDIKKGIDVEEMLAPFADASKEDGREEADPGELLKICLNLGTLSHERTGLVEVHHRDATGERSLCTQERTEKKGSKHHVCLQEVWVLYLEHGTHGKVEDHRPLV